MRMNSSVPDELGIYKFNHNIVDSPTRDIIDIK
jgi:hypothetical protein